MEYWLPIAHWIYDFQTLITGILAVIAAAVTIWQVRIQIANAQKARVEDQLIADQASLSTLFLKVFLIADHVSRSYRHLVEVNVQSPDMDSQDLWQYFQPTIRDNGPKFRIDPSELQILTKIKKSDIIQSIAEMDRICGMDEDFVKHYEALRTKFGSMVEDLVSYEFSEKGIQGQATLTADDSPLAVRTIHEMRSVLDKYVPFLNSSFDHAKILMEELTTISKEQNLAIAYSLPEKSQILETAMERVVTQ